MSNTKDLKELSDFQVWWKDNYYEIFGAGTSENGYWTAEYNAAAIAWDAAIKNTKTQTPKKIKE